MRTIDYQRQRVYNWENHVVGPRDNTQITPEEAQDLVDFIWANEGYAHPPKVSMDHRKQSGADATRTTIRFTQSSLYRWIVVHEIAHSFEAIKGCTDGHGPDFVTRYIDLLEKYMKIPKVMLWYTLKEANLDFRMF